MEMSRIKGGLGEIQRFFCPLEQKNFRTTRPFYISTKYIGAQRPQRKPAIPSSSSFYSLFEFYKSALKFAWPQNFDSIKAMIARGWATLLLDRLRDFVVVPSSAGGNSSFELHSQSMEERATFDRYHHFHGHLGMCA